MSAADLCSIPVAANAASRTGPRLVMFTSVSCQPGEEQSASSGASSDSAARAACASHWQRRDAFVATGGREFEHEQGHGSRDVPGRSTSASGPIPLAARCMRPGAGLSTPLRGYGSLTCAPAQHGTIRIGWARAVRPDFAVQQSHGRRQAWASGGMLLRRPARGDALP